MYRKLRLAKFEDNQKEAMKMANALNKVFEEELRTDVILMLRDAETERFFGEKKL